MNQYLLAATSLTLMALSLHTSQAQEITLAVGGTDFNYAGRDGPVIDFEYRHTPFFERDALSVALGVNASLSAEGDVFVGGGVWARLDWPSGWFVDLSVMPGLYQEGVDENDLGSAFEIRSLLGVGYAFSDTRAVSAAFSHKSNANLADSNPGANTYAIRYHLRF